MLQTQKKMRRTYPQTFLLNELELKAINKYCNKYKINNRSRFIRETVISEILKQFDKDYPRLFNLPEPRKVQPVQKTIVFPE
jgi:hypothetical protein